MSKTLLRLLAIVLAFGLIAAACGDDDDSADAYAGVELKIGYVLPQTGGLSGIIDALLKPIEMAEEEIRSSGGEFTLIPGDSGTDNAVASATVDGLIADGVQVIIGPASTGVTLGVIDKITGSGILECSGSTTGAVFSSYPDDGFYFRTSPPDSIQGPVLADMMTDDGVSSVAIIHRNDEYGVGLADALEGGLKANGVGIAAVVSIDEDAASYDAEAGQVAASGADATVLITFGEGAALMQALIEQGVGPDDIATYVTDGFKDEVTVDEVDPDNPALFEGIRGTAPSVAPPEGDPTFLDRFAVYAPDVPTIFSPMFYDCLIVVKLAHDAAGSSDPALIRDQMGPVTNGGQVCARYAECSELIAAGTDINYTGASGTVDLDANGEPTSGSYDLYEYDAESKAQAFETITLANE
jgi:branched-chain amino acid transport system substrate-binding protein